MFRTSAVVAATGCTYRQVNFWCRQGYVHPDMPASGQGTDAWFLGLSYLHARRVAWLVLAGVTPDSADILARGINLPLGPGEELRIVKR